MIRTRPISPNVSDKSQIAVGETGGFFLARERRLLYLVNVGGGGFGKRRIFLLKLHTS